MAEDFPSPHVGHGGIGPEVMTLPSGGDGVERSPAFPYLPKLDTGCARHVGRLPAGGDQNATGNPEAGAIFLKRVQTRHGGQTE